MPKRTDIKSIVIIGAGPIVIGQACEFDYSGTQACKALREEGYRVILINSNPATIMTDPNLADATYVEPITPGIVARILEIEKPDALLPTMGGQTALNTALALAEDGTLERLGIELIGANREAIAKAEDRQLFRDCMDQLGLSSPKSVVVKTLQQGIDALAVTGLPAIIRPSFTLAGTGGGIAYNRQEFESIVREGLDASPVNEVLVEESVLGWKEYEMEVVRDKNDNCIIVCSIENIDPMGVHTGDSITVAPAITLTDKEYQLMRNASIAVLRGIGVETGGSNVQFAVNPEDGRMVVIEMNPRVSRSSALASKATGFPIAKIAAKLAVGYTLDELGNDITGGKIPASFEPTIDYIVTKIPRFAFEKFKGADNGLTTSMKSVGEAMAMGRCFEESLQKALRSLEVGLSGFDEMPILPDGKTPDTDQIRAKISKPTPQRLLFVAQAMRHGMSVEDIHNVTKYDRWFLERIKRIIDAEENVRKEGLPKDEQGWTNLKKLGFADARLAKITNMTEDAVRRARHKHKVHPVYKRIDSCAAEIPSVTPYMYGTYETPAFGKPQSEIEATTKEKVIILGGGPNRIGQGIEFDYCCVHAAYALKEAGYETIMVNCNPETVSTDYDTSDRLYFEPLTIEDVVEIIMAESPVKGVIVQLGGQTPLKLAQALKNLGIPILGTDPDAIDLAEDRERFKKLIDKLKLKQPRNDIATSLKDALEKADKIGFPLVLRPSYVLGGRAMQIVYDREGVEKYMTSAVHVSGKNPVLLDSYLQAATEVDVDVLADGSDVYVAGIMEHIEEAGIHSGDSACVLPPHSLAYKVVREIEKQSIQLAKGLNVQGLMNIQFAVKKNRDTGENDIYVLEVNPRASRTVPFVAKATNVPVAKIAARIMAGEPLAGFRAQGLLLGMNADHTAVKAPVFPFSRFPGVDVLLGPEMKSTGEVIGIDRDVAQAYAKSQLGAGMKLPREGRVFLSVHDLDKAALVPIARDLADLGFEIVATGGTCTALQKAGLNVIRVNKVSEGQPHVVDSIINGDVSLIINTTFGPQSIDDGLKIRRAGLMNKVPYYTNMAAAVAAVQAIRAMKARSFTFTTLQGYFAAPTDLKQSA